MTEIQVTITNASGLHARPAAQFVQKAASFKSKVRIATGNKVADGKSILAVMSMGLKQNTQITITTEGEDEIECCKALEDMIKSNFGEH
ncbi:MAG: Phosphotransferase system, phosphocarrier protein HPr [Pelosinus sp.]|jgi:phosphocarrier protein|nr:Phosphotransferase system, phosphocarrier protein HPr [Pelosinus sp.]